MKKGEKMSEEMKKKVSRGVKKAIEEGRLKSVGGWNKGMEGYTNKGSFKKGRTSYWKGKKHSKETIKKIKRARAKQIITEEHKKKIAEAHRGKKRSKETRDKISKQKIGDKNPNWNGGSSYEPYPSDWTETLKRAIRERDNYICQICNSSGKHVHHIDYDKQNCNSDNLITLCGSCHSATNHNRDTWKQHFTN